MKHNLKKKKSKRLQKGGVNRVLSIRGYKPYKTNKLSSRKLTAESKIFTPKTSSLSKTVDYSKKYILNFILSGITSTDSKEKKGRFTEEVLHYSDVSVQFRTEVSPDESLYSIISELNEANEKVHINNDGIKIHLDTIKFKNKSVKVEDVILNPKKYRYLKTQSFNTSSRGVDCELILEIE